MEKAKILDINIENLLLNKWKSLDTCSKKAFFWMFGIINVVFLWHTITFFFGNHDWMQIRQGIPVGWSVFDGRYAAGMLQQITGGDILPVLNNLFCFAGFCFAMIALAKYWNIPKTTFTYVIFGLSIMLLPYTYPWLQFVRSETHFWNILIVILGLNLCQTKSLKLQLLAIPFFIFSIACYGAIIEAIVCIFLGKCILDIWFEYTDFKNFVLKYYKTVIYITASVIIYGMTYLFLYRNNYLQPFHTTNINTYDMILEKIIALPMTLKATFFNELPYIPSYFKIFLLSSLPICCIFIYKKKWHEILLIATLFTAMIFTTQFMNILSSTDFYNVLRLDFFCVPYIYALGWTILLRQKKNIWKSIALLMMFFSVYYSTIQAFRDQKVKYFEQQQAIKIFDDIRFRIKSNPKFDPDKQYKMFMIGSAEIADSDMGFDHFNNEVGFHNVWLPFVPDWNAKYFFDFYEKKSFIQLSYSVWAINLSDDDLLTMDLNYLLHKARAWPNIHSVHIDNEYIYIIFDNNELYKIKNRIRKLNSEKHHVKHSTDSKK